MTAICAQKDVHPDPDRLIKQRQTAATVTWKIASYCCKSSHNITPWGIRRPYWPNFVSVLQCCLICTYHMRQLSVSNQTGDKKYISRYIYLWPIPCSPTASYMYRFLMSLNYVYILRLQPLLLLPVLFLYEYVWIYLHVYFSSCY